MAAQQTVDVSGWEVAAFEQMGSKAGKLWLEAPPQAPVEQGRWLFKARTLQRENGRCFPKGDDWAEKLAGEVAVRLAIPSARVEMVTRQGEVGTISHDISGGLNLVSGNEVLFGQDSDYDRRGRRSVPGYTVEAIMDALRALRVSAPVGESTGDACSVFAGYLLLDAVVGNTDRHHENWGVLVAADGGAPPALAATFDHASSLGFQLSDGERHERLTTHDRNRTVQAYAERGQSRPFDGSPRLLELALAGLRHCTAATRHTYRARLKAFDETAIVGVLAAMPQTRWSPVAAAFAGKLIQVNRRRLLDAFDHQA